MRVWAPAATQVSLLTETELPMTAAPDGWWEAQPPPHGTDYRFVLDGGEPLPDPRSPWQPNGVHGPSRTFDTSRHEWADGDWPGQDARGALTYELHIGTFTPEGTLDAAIGRLGHLVDLGVAMVELMPVAAFPGRRGWGYDGVALYAVHEPYGGPAALQRFVDAAHRHALAVCLDVVYNHLGPAGNYLPRFGPYFTDRHHTPWGQAVNLDGPGAAEVRGFLVDNALRWLREFHVDALRLDAVHALADDSPRHFLARLSDAVTELSAELGRPLSLIAESDRNDPRTVQPTATGGLGMTAQWADDVHHAIHAYLTGERHGYYVDFGSPQTLAKAMTKVFVHDGGWSTHREQPWGHRVPDDVDGHRFVVCASNHDQVGNRALGDRPSARLDPGRLATAAALVLCGPYTPLVFMGEEWGASTPWQYFTDHEGELGEQIRQGRTAEFAEHGWGDLYGPGLEVPNPQDPRTFEASKLDWSEPGTDWHARLLAWYRVLISLRALPELASGDRGAVVVQGGPDWLVLARGAIRVCATIGARSFDLGGEVEVLATWAGAAATPDGVELPERSVAVLRLREASVGA